MVQVLDHQWDGRLHFRLEDASLSNSRRCTLQRRRLGTGAAFFLYYDRLCERIQGTRPEGPVVSSHAREHVEQVFNSHLEARRAGSALSHVNAGPSDLQPLFATVHALTRVATDYRPFGPKTDRTTMFCLAF